MNAAIAWLQERFYALKAYKIEVSERFVERDFFISDGSSLGFVSWCMMGFWAFGFSVRYYGIYGIDGIESLPSSLFFAILSISIFFGFVGGGILFFLFYAADFFIMLGLLFLFISSFCIILIQLSPASSHNAGTFIFKLFFCPPALLFLLYMLPAFMKASWRTFWRDKSRQAHMLFLLSMAALGWALWLLNGGNWQQMAAFNSPVKIPFFDAIPYTDIVAAPFALVGLIENSGVWYSTFKAHFVDIVASLSAAAVLFFFAINRLGISIAPLRPQFGLFAFAIFFLAVYLEIALHWAGAPALPPELILFNRAFAVLAFAVYLFWRERCKDAPDADFEKDDNGDFDEAIASYLNACDEAEARAWHIATWLLALVLAATFLSRLSLSDFPYLPFALIIGLFLFYPVRLMMTFNGDFQAALLRYNKLLKLHQKTYQSPPTVATREQIQEALSGRSRVVDGETLIDTGE